MDEKIVVRCDDNLQVPVGTEESRDSNNNNRLVTLTPEQYEEMLSSNGLTEEPIFGTLKLVKNGDMVGWIESAPANFMKSRR